jgi:hypothetical protein
MRKFAYSDGSGLKEEISCLQSSINILGMARFSVGDQDAR